MTTIAGLPSIHEIGLGDVPESQYEYVLAYAAYNMLPDDAQHRYQVRVLLIPRKQVEESA